jgi:hypothetical protein
MPGRRSNAFRIILIITTLSFQRAYAQTPKPNPNVTLDPVVKTVPATVGTQVGSVSQGDFDRFREDLGQNIPCDDTSSILVKILKSKKLPVNVALERKHTAYLLHVAEWQPGLLGTYQIQTDQWIAYRKLNRNKVCTLISTGSKKNTTNDPLLYGIRNVLFVGIDHFRGSIDVNSISLGYDLSTTPDTPQTVSDLGALIYALLGATLPTSTVSSAGGGAAGNAPNLLVAAASFDNPPRLPYFVNISLSVNMTQLGGLPIAQVGLPYAGAVTAVGGTGVYTYVINKGQLPPGLALDPQSGAISGTPTAASSQEFTILAIDNSRQGNRQTLQTFIEVKDSVIVKFSAVPISGGLTTGVVGTPYLSSVNATGGTAPYIYSLAEGSNLPAGFNLDPSTGDISGTPGAATASGAVLSFRIVDSSTPRQVFISAPAPFTVNAPSGNTFPQKTLKVDLTPPAPSNPFPNGGVDAPYVSAIVATGGKAPYTYRCDGLSAAGLTLNPSTGIVSGLPTKSQALSIKCSVSDSTTSGSPAIPAPLSTSWTVTLNVGSTLPVMPAGNVSAQLGVTKNRDEYTTTIKSTNDGNPIFSCPECGYYGFKITPAGELSGSPTKVGVMSVIATTNGQSSALPISVTTDTKDPQKEITVTPEKINVLSGSILGALLGSPYSMQITIKNGTYTYSCPFCDSDEGIGLGVLPSGELNGTPSRTGSFFSTIVAQQGPNSFAVPVEFNVEAPGLALSVGAASAGQQNQTNAQATPNQGGAQGPGTKGSQQGKGQGNGNQSANPSSNPGGNAQGAPSGSSQPIKCAFSVGNPCTFSRNFRSDDRELLDFSMGVVVPGPKERIYSSSTSSSSISSSLTTHTDAYALLDLFPFFLLNPKNGVLPHCVVGLPVTSQVFHRPIFGISENITSWTGLEKLGFPTTSIFGGVVYMQQQVLTPNGALSTDRVVKSVFGIEVSLSSLISKIGSAAKKGSSK